MAVRTFAGLLRQRERANGQMRARAAGRAAAGLCVMCGERAPRDGGRSCDDCLDRARVRRNERKAEARRQ